MSRRDHTYADFQDAASALTEALRQMATVWDDLGPGASEDAGGRGERLRTMAAHLEEDTFNLMIVGEFKRGKSTLINAMLGKPLLPAKIAPCTAVITQVHFGDREIARLFFRDANRPPLEVPATDLKKYVAIDHSNDGPIKARSAEYSRMEVEAPLALCRNGVALTDSPGLNEHETRTEVSLKFLTEADALVLVLNCEQALSGTELDFLTRTVGQHGHDIRNVFVVWNHYEVVRDSEDDDRELRQRSRAFLEPVVGGPSRVFYVSALEALKGRRDNDAPVVQRSGLISLERALEAFLATERAALKLRNPLGAATVSLRELGPALERRRHLLQSDLAPLQQRYQAARPRLEKLAKDREKIRRRIESTRDDLGERLAESYRSFVASVRPALREALEKEEIGITDLVMNRKALEKTLGEILSKELEEQIGRWSARSVAPTVERSMRTLEDALHEGVAEYVRELEALRDGIAGGVTATRVEEADESVFGRVLAAAGGFALGGVGGAVMGGAMGFQRMLGNMVPHLVLVIGALVLGMNPVGLLVLSLLSGVGLTAMQGGSMKRELKDSLAKAFHEALLKESAKVEARLREDVDARLDELRDKVDGELALMVDELRGQVEEALRELTARREDVERRASTLLAHQTELESISSQLEQVRAYAGA